MTFIIAIGDSVKRSCRTDIFNRAKFSTVERVESFLVGNKVKQTRCAHQESLAFLTSLETQAFNLCNEGLNFQNWTQQLSSKSATAAFWFTVLELKIFLMMYVLSIREGDFKLFVLCLCNIIPWMFALDYIHYALWLTVHIAELLSLEAENSKKLESFVGKYFTISKSKRTFSKLAIDKAHEQNNKLVTVDGEAIGILAIEATILKWAVARPISESCKQLMYLKTNLTKYMTITKIRNYFKTNQKAIESVECAKYIGNQQFKLFVRERLIEECCPFVTL